MNKAIVLIDLMMKELNIDKYSDLALYLGVTPGSISGWVKRNSINTIIKHAAKKRMDVNYLQKKIDEFINNEYQTLDAVDDISNFLKQDQKEKFFIACEKYKITLENIASSAKISVEDVEKRKKENTPVRFFGDYDSFLSICFFEKYQGLMRERVSTTETKRTLFAETYLVTIKFPKPLFWLIWCCIGFFVLDGKIKAEDVEDFLDILIQNRKNFGDDISSIQTSDDLINTCLAKIEEFLPKSNINQVEEFIKQSTMT